MSFDYMFCLFLLSSFSLFLS